MNKSVIKKGSKYGKLTVIRFDHMNKNHRQCCLFKCDCGKEKVICFGSVKNGHTKSCGCLSKQKVIERNKKSKIHGMYKTKTYHVWTGIKNRCLNSNNLKYKNWGGRGITICSEWSGKNGFENFYRDMGERPEGKSLDRIDNNGNYCKENCHWSSQKEQMNNTRVNHLLTYNGKTQTVSQWAEEVEINCHTLFTRLRRGWTIKRALNF